MQIFTVSALAGAAKTYNAIRFAAAGVWAGEKYIFSVPSGYLASQIEVDWFKSGCSAALTTARTASAGRWSRRLVVILRAAPSHRPTWRLHVSGGLF